MKTVALYSGGVCSHLAVQRYIESTGVRPTLLFSDTGVEDEDLYRFIEEGSRRLGCELVTVRSGETFDEMIVRHNALPNDRMPFCSRELKVKPAELWLKKNRGYTTMVLGLDWTETHRLPRVQRRWPSFNIVAPMMEAPYLMKAEMLSLLDIPPPKLYARGYQHNNCGGGCVRGGLAAWRHLLRTDPERYAEWERRENLIPNHSFARDRSGGGSRPYRLERLRLDATPPMFDDCDFGGCGCFVDDD